MGLMSNFIKLIISERINFCAQKKKITPAFLCFDLCNSFERPQCDHFICSVSLAMAPVKSDNIRIWPKPQSLQFLSMSCHPGWLKSVG